MPRVLAPHRVFCLASVDLRNEEFWRKFDDDDDEANGDVLIAREAGVAAMWVVAQIAGSTLRCVRAWQRFVGCEARNEDMKRVLSTMLKCVIAAEKKPFLFDLRTRSWLDVFLRGLIGLNSCAWFHTMSDAHPDAFLPLRATSSRKRKRPAKSL